MTDYLEELWENTGALLEQVRRLEREPSASAEGSSPLSPASSVEGAVLQREIASQESRSLPENAPDSEGAPAPEEQSEEDKARPSAQTAAELEPPQRVLTPLEEEESSSPLLEQLELTERASSFLQRAAAFGTAAVQRDGGNYPLELSKSGVSAPGGEVLSAWREGAGLERPLPLPGSELRWAEQADRAFRRDSRRYDGGFYLY